MHYINVRQSNNWDTSVSVQTRRTSTFVMSIHNNNCIVPAFTVTLQTQDVTTARSTSESEMGLVAIIELKSTRNQPGMEMIILIVLMAYNMNVYELWRRCRPSSFAFYV